MSKKNKNRYDDYRKPDEFSTGIEKFPASEVESQPKMNDLDTTNEVKTTDDDNSGKSLSEIKNTLTYLIQEVKLLTSNERTYSRDIQALKNRVYELEQNIKNDFYRLPQKNDLDVAMRNVTGDMKNLNNNVKINLNENVDKLKKYIAESGKDVTGALTALVQKRFESQNNNHVETLGHLSKIKGKVEEISQSTEMMQSLPKKIDGLVDILSDKGLQFKQDFPVINHDEETLAELAEFGEKILQQLAIAARWYARKLPEINSHEQALQNLSKTKDKEKAVAQENGKELGRKAVIKELLARYDDIYKLMSGNPDGAEERLKILSAFLTNQGVEQIYQINEEFEITDANLMQFEPYFHNLQTGKIIVTSPAYTFDSQIIAKATYIYFTNEIETEHGEQE